MADGPHHSALPGDPLVAAIAKLPGRKLIFTNGDTPYALNVDRPRGIVWVNGNQSDSLYTFDIASETWGNIPMPRRVTFTRDVEFDPDGVAYTAIAHFPGWHVEDGQSTLIRVERP